MTNEKDNALALQVVRDVDAAFEKSERLRLGRWVLPNEREQAIAQFITKALTTVRQEARRAAFTEAIRIAKEEAFERRLAQTVYERLVEAAADEHKGSNHE